MQAHAAPVRRRQQRRVDVLEFRRARAVVVVAETPPLCLAGNIGAACRELIVGQRLWTGDKFAGDRALRATRPNAVLNTRDLARIPARQEVGQDAAMAAELAIIVRRTFPDAQGAKMRRP